MKKMTTRISALLLSWIMTTGLLAPAVSATEVTEDPVEAVIAQLEAIDSLETMQSKRYTYTVTKAHYDTGTTDSAIAEEHEAARAAYEDYLAQMFAARIAAQKAYDALDPSQKAQISSDLTAKLNDELDTVFNTATYAVTPGDNEYTFEAVKGPAGYGYEVSNYMVSGNIPQTFILVDTSDGKTSWTPNGQYEYGTSNYDVAYCCDILTTLEYSTHYKRLNLEDSNYYGESSAKHIRAILMNSYPFISIEEMKANLLADGMTDEFVNSLSRADLISAVQMAVWTYANVKDNNGSLGYFASVDTVKNTGIYFTPLHDYTNEMWEWFPGKRQRSYDARAEYRVNTLAYYLCNLDPVEPAEDEIVITDVEVTRADLVEGSDGLYDLGIYVHLNTAAGAGDDLKVIAGDSNQTVVAGQDEVQMTVRAKDGDVITVVIEGTQNLGKGVYFYEPEGGRDVSQSLVGVAEGITRVRAEKEFVFNEEPGMKGLRIYKTVTGTGTPLSEIDFSVYKVVPGEGESISDIPTEEEIAKYKTEANKVGTVTTDVTGYASIALEDGYYLVVEESSDKVVAPVAPFYICVPMPQTLENDDGTTVTTDGKVVSVYPKNEPVIPPEEPPVIPPVPDKVTGQFDILKHDSVDKSKVLEGAEFAVYRPATTADEASEIITSGGVQYAVVPVIVNGAPLTLVTDENGYARSPELPCGTYYLVETDAPFGYNLLDEAVSVTVVSSVLSQNTVEIGNQMGSILPETGAEGTRRLITIGSIVTVTAAVLLITKKRMSIYE